MRNYMPVREFVKLTKNAEKALKTKDCLQLLDINESIGKIGYRLVHRKGVLHIQQMSIADAPDTPKTD